MLDSVGSFATEWADTEPDTARMSLLGLTLVKLAAATLPLLAARGVVVPRAPVYIISWAGSVLLILWGGVSFVGAAIGLVLSAENRAVKYGHLFFDGLFLLWGTALLAALLVARRGNQPAR